MPTIYNKPSNIAYTVNWLLIIFIVSINSYVLWGMFGPRIALQVKSSIADPPKIEALDNRTTENRLVIPSIYLDTKINEGSTYDALLSGAWRRPATSTPELGGNTVLAGHRFTYQGASIFYNLDKVRIGDEIGVTYNGKLYKYKVREVVITTPSNTDIEAPKNETILTLYTCTPLWTTEKRLVIIAEMDDGN